MFDRILGAAVREHRQSAPTLADLEQRLADVLAGAVASGRYDIQITLAPRILFHAIGMARPRLCSMLVGSPVMGSDKAAAEIARALASLIHRSFDANFMARITMGWPHAMPRTRLTRQGAHFVTNGPTALVSAPALQQHPDNRSLEPEIERAQRRLARLARLALRHGFTRLETTLDCDAMSAHERLRAEARAATLDWPTLDWGSPVRSAIRRFFAGRRSGTAHPPDRT